MENLLDKARHDELTLTPDIIDVFLDTKDVMASQLDAYKNDSLPDEETFKRICEVLSRVENRAEEVTETTAALPETKVDVAVVEEAPAEQGEYSHYFMISLNQLKENEVDLLADELSLFGHLYHTEKTANSLQAWLGTNTDIDDISGVLCFVVDESQIAHQVVSFADCLALSPEEVITDGSDGTIEIKIPEPEKEAKPVTVSPAVAAPANTSKNLQSLNRKGIRAVFVWL